MRESLYRSQVRVLTLQVSSYARDVDAAAKILSRCLDS